jgi:hypothetical protein
MSNSDDVEGAEEVLNGDSEYRNVRLKIILSIVEAHWQWQNPSPPKKELRRIVHHCQ